MRGIVAIAAAGTLAMGIVTANAATVVENFDYGETSGNLNTFGSAADGWGGAWFGGSGPDYLAGSNLTYTAPGYSNAGNTGGMAGYGGSDAGDIASRLLDSPMTGTIWVSALARVTGNQSDAILWFRNDPHGDNANFIALRGSVNDDQTAPVPVLRYGASQNLLGTQTVALNTVHLLLARITVNYEGNFDRIEFWVNPDLSNGEAGLGAPLLSADGASVLNAVAGPRVSFSSGGAIDAIRISNDPDGFLAVTAVPEPTMLGWAASMLVMAVRPRSRR